MSSSWRGGGARPNSFNFLLPSGRIQFELHGGEYVILTSTSCAPASRMFLSISFCITSRAGQPAKVGVMSTTTFSFSIPTLRISPISTTDTTGISGSFICSKIFQIPSIVKVVINALWTIHSLPSRLGIKPGDGLHLAHQDFQMGRMLVSLCS